MQSADTAQSPMVLERSTSSGALHVDLMCSLTRHADRLEVRYRIDNRRKDELAVMDRIQSTGIDGADEFLPDDVYVDLHGEAVQLIKGALLVRDMFPAVYDYPDARMVAPGGSLEGTFVVPIPVKVRTRYKRLGLGEPRASKKAAAREVVIQIGVVPASAGCKFSRHHPAYPDVVTVTGDISDPTGAYLLQCQTMLSVRFELPEDLPVLDYETFPWPR